MLCSAITCLTLYFGQEYFNLKDNSKEQMNAGDETRSSLAIESHENINTESQASSLQILQQKGKRSERVVRSSNGAVPTS